MKIYLDTNILRDCLKNRNIQSIRLMEIIRQKKIECITSAFALMELMDNEKEHSFFFKKLSKGMGVNKILNERKNKELNPYDLGEISNQIDAFKQTYNFLQFVVIKEVAGWQMAIDVCRQGCVSAPDSLHFASALGSGCNLLVTNDTSFKKEGNKFIGALVDTDGEKVNLDFKIIDSKEAINEIEGDEAKNNKIKVPKKGE